MAVLPGDLGKVYLKSLGFMEIAFVLVDCPIGGGGGGSGEFADVVVVSGFGGSLFIRLVAVRMQYPHRCKGKFASNRRALAIFSNYLCFLSTLALSTLAFCCEPFQSYIWVKKIESLLLEVLKSMDVQAWSAIGECRSLWERANDMDEVDALEAPYACVCPCDCINGRNNGERDQRKRFIQFLMGLDENYTNVRDLEEFCEKHYEKLLPIMADKYEYERRKKEKLEEVKARLDFGEARRKSTKAQESAYSESRTMSPRRQR
ncbi:hypothetical protein Tco_0471805, partial [Tanacetum coccineum]